MRRILTFLFVLAVGLVFSMQAHADLTLLGQGTSTHGTYNLIYDTDLDITWYDYTSYGDWQTEVDWADALSVTFGSITLTDWRLPIIFDTSCGGSSSEYNCTNSEMGHLYYTELGNTAGGPMSNTDDFQNLQPYGYWTGTEYAPDPVKAWVFDFTDGGQNYWGHKVGGGRALAVMDELAVVPEPISSVLFIVGGATLGFRLYRKKRSIA